MRKRRSLLAGAIVGLCLTLIGCDVATPFRSPPGAAQAAAAETVFVALTHATLREDEALREVFWEQVDQVEASLERESGFLGYSLRRQLLGNEAWTMTVWRDEPSLLAFVNGATHLTAIRDAAPALASARFARVELPRSALPLSWERALALLDEHARAGY